MKVVRGAAAAGFAALLVGLSSSIAQAATHTATVTVHCDVNNPSNLVTMSHSSGALSYKQTSTSPSINRYNWAVSSNGNALSKKATVDGATVKWTGVKASNYTFKTVIVSNFDCDGWWPGQGTSSLNYTAKTNQ